MHIIRRAVFRAAASPSTSLCPKSRSITTTSSRNLLRPRAQSPISQSIFRRFNSDDASVGQPSVGSADGEHSTVQSAIDSASQTAGDYTSRSPPPSEFVPRELPPTKAIYIGNLLFDITAEDLRREFAQFGPIHNTTIAADARGLSKGFGYVEFETLEDAGKAIQAKNQTVFEGRRIIVNYQAKGGQSKDKNPPSKTLFIGNLAFEMSDADLNKLFREIRNVIDVRVAIDRRTGQPRGFAHADFVDVESAMKALDSLQGREIYGRTLRVDYSGTSRDRNPAFGSKI